MSIVQGVKIYLPGAVTEDTSIGLYTAAGVSQLRWIEVAITGTTDTWKAGVVAQGGIPPIVEDGDFSVGGRFVTVKPMTLTVDNAAPGTATDQLWKKLDALFTASGYGISALRADIIEFDKDDTTGVVTETVRAYLSTRYGDWDSRSMEIPLEPAVINRNAFMGTLIDEENYPNASANLIGKPVPITFGKFTGSDRFVKYQRVADKETVWTAQRLCSYLVEKVPADYYEVSGTENETVFPVIGGGITNTRFTIAIGNTGIGSWGDSIIVDTSADNLWVKIVKGNLAGVYRKVNNITDGLSGLVTIDLYVDTWFSEFPAADSDGDGDWVSLVQFSSTFAADENDITAVVDVNGDALAAPELYKLDDGVYTRLPSYVYSIRSGEPQTLDVDLSLCDGGPNAIDSFIALPPKEVKLTTSLSYWDFPTYYKSQDGLFVSGLGTSSGLVLTGDLGNITDGDISTGLQFAIEHSGLGDSWAACLTLVPPALPDDFDFDTVHIGVRAKIDNSGRAKFANIKWRRWMGSPTVVLSQSTGDDYDLYLDDLPDFYLGRDTDEEFFYFERSADIRYTLPSGYYVSGHTLLQLTDVNDIDTYRSVHEVLLHFGFVGKFAGASETHNVNVYEVCFIFKKAGQAVGTELYSRVKGRTYGDTWDSRKTSTDMMRTLVDFYEHVCRLQNWSEAGDTDIDIGREYAPNALIDTTTIDALGDPAYDTSFQLTEENEMWTMPLKERILRAMWCAGYVDEQGRETVAYLPVSDLSPSDTVTLADVPVGMRPGTVKEPRAEDVFAQPFVRYGYDTGTQKFTGLLGISQVHRDTYDQSYTPGFGAGEGEYFWELCKTEIWGRYRMLTDPPSDMTDQYLIGGSHMARWFLTQWIAWMLARRVSVPVYYAKAKSWHVGRHVYLNLPHETDGVAVECVVEGIVKNKNKGYCELQLAMLDRVIGTDFYWVNTMDTGNPQYVNTMDTGNTQYTGNM